ncbi:MAG: zinc metallopeptidase [Clostridia bacterium]|nr:zinc metallopeptidase [Clostridia bacterium]
MILNLNQSYLYYLIPFGVFFILLIISYVVLFSQMRKSTKVKIEDGPTGAEVVKIVLEHYNIRNIMIVVTNNRRVKGNYDYSAGMIQLSPAVYYNNRLLAMCIAAHEAGYAVQVADGNNYLIINKFISFIAKIVLTLSLPGILIGFMVMSNVIINSCILAFCAAVILTLFTLPSEIDASAKAIKAIKEEGILNKTEYQQFKKMMHAACLTYVATGFTAFLVLFEFFDFPYDK